MHKISPYYLRFFVYFILAITAIVGQYIGYFDKSTALILLGLTIVTPCIGYLSSIARTETATDLFALSLLDAIVASIVVLLVGETNIITLLFLLTLIFNTYIFNTQRTTLITLFALCFFIGLLTYFLPKSTYTTPPTPLIFSAFLSTSLYFVACGKYISQIRNDQKTLQKTIELEQQQQQLTAQELKKYISPQVWESIFGKKKNQRIETQRKKFTIFFSDIKDFSALAEQLEAEVFTDLLNHYLTEMSTIAKNYGGTIDKFVGDSIMVFFGDTNSQGAEADALAATSMAIAMQNHMRYIRNHWISRGIIHHLEIRIGINTGYCTVGNFGASTKMDYTIVGREVNLASRLEGACTPGEILISEETYALVKNTISCRDKGEIAVKGFHTPIKIFEVAGFRNMIDPQSYYTALETRGFSLHLDSLRIKPEEKSQLINTLEEALKKLKND